MNDARSPRFVIHWHASPNSDALGAQLLNDLVVIGLRTPSLRAAIATYQRELEAAFEDAFRDAAARVGLSPARPIRDVARFFFAGMDGLLVHRLTRQADDEDERTLRDLVEATTALAEEHGATSGPAQERVPAARWNT